MLIRTSFAVGTLLHQKHLDQCQIWTKARCYDDSCHTIPWSKQVLWKLSTFPLLFVSASIFWTVEAVFLESPKFVLSVFSVGIWGNQFEYVIAEKEVKAVLFRSDILAAPFKHDICSVITSHLLCLPVWLGNVLVQVVVSVFYRSLDLDIQ